MQRLLTPSNSSGQTASSLHGLEPLEPRVLLSATVPLTDLPLLHSNPAATKKIFLDFDGHIDQSSWWGSNDIHTAAYDTDGDVFSYSTSELNAIIRAWETVAEDYAPFDVDVTTEEPPLSTFTNGNEGIRVIFGTKFDEVSAGGTGAQWFNSGGAGVAYINSWSWTSDTPVWVFNTAGGNVASHEAGHSLGLRHDAVLPHSPSANIYYSGHNVSGTSYKWYTIMGSGTRTDSVSQWSQGEYNNANNQEDDIAILASKLGFRADDHADTPGNPSTATSLAASGGVLLDDGIIGDRNDLDVFRVTVAAGDTLLVEAQANPVNRNLDSEIKVYDSAGVELDSHAPTDSFDSFLRLDLAAGDYYVSVDGVGLNTPSNGYSDYGSLGQYTIAGLLSDIPSVYRIDELPNENQVFDVFFSEDLSSSLDAIDLQIVSTSGQVIDTSSAILDTASESWDLSDVHMPTGDYVATLLSSGLTDAQGNALDGDGDGVAGGDFSVSFSFREPGDANLDGFVDGLDYVIVQANQGTTPSGGNVALWEDGDFNGDGYVNSTDLSIFGQNHLVYADLPIAGDFTHDGVLNGSDIDFMYRGVNIVAGITSEDLFFELYNTETYDLNGDQAFANGITDINQLDVDYLVETIIGTEYGDANANGHVDQDDFDVVLNNFGATDVGWAGGDFDSDGVVGQSDLDLVYANWDATPDNLPRVVAVAIGSSLNGQADYLVPTGSGDQLRSVAVANPDTISVQFSEDVSVAQGSFTLDGVNVFRDYSSLGLLQNSTFSYDANTFTASWTFTDSVFDMGQYMITLQAGVGHVSAADDYARLDGEWINPVSISDTAASLKDMARYGSGDGTEGGDFKFVFSVLPGDGNGDGIASQFDLNLVLLNWDPSGSGGPVGFADGDYNGDGVIDSDDESLVLAQWGENQQVLFVNGDVTGDYKVDNDDLNRWSANQGMANPLLEDGDADQDGDVDNDDAGLIFQHFGIEIPVSV